MWNYRNKWCEVTGRWPKFQSIGKIYRKVENEWAFSVSWMSMYSDWIAFGLFNKHVFLFRSSNIAVCAFLDGLACAPLACFIGSVFLSYCVWHAYIFILHDILHKCAHYHNGALSMKTIEQSDRFERRAWYTRICHTFTLTNTRKHPLVSLAIEMPAQSKCVRFNAQQTQPNSEPQFSQWLWLRIFHFFYPFY